MIEDGCVVKESKLQQARNFARKFYDVMLSRKIPISKNVYLYQISKSKTVDKFAFYFYEVLGGSDGIHAVIKDFDKEQFSLVLSMTDVAHTPIFRYLLKMYNALENDAKNHALNYTEAEDFKSILNLLKDIHFHNLKKQLSIPVTPTEVIIGIFKKINNYQCNRKKLLVNLDYHEFLLVSNMFLKFIEFESIDRKFCMDSLSDERSKNLKIIKETPDKILGISSLMKL